MFCMYIRDSTVAACMLSVVRDEQLDRNQIPNHASSGSFRRSKPRVLRKNLGYVISFYPKQITLLSRPFLSCSLALPSTSLHLLPSRFPARCGLPSCPPPVGTLWPQPSTFQTPGHESSAPQSISWDLASSLSCWLDVPLLRTSTLYEDGENLALRN